MNVADEIAAAAPAVRYVGFWRRFAATMIDTVIASLALAPLAYFFGVDLDLGASLNVGGGFDTDLVGAIFHPPSLAAFTLNWVLPAIAVLAFWFTRGATPGKMAISAVIVDARTLEPPSQGQLVARYLGYYVAIVPFCLGLAWVAFDKRKQGWHDKIAGTVVVDRRR